MKFQKLGKSGLTVSKACFGTMSMGDKNPMVEWVMDEDEGRRLVRLALELGVNFFDSANIYSLGTSERQLGAALNDFAVRDEIVIATKAYFSVSQAPNMAGLSRKALFHQCEASLKRLGTDYIDLYQVHRWDDHTPIEETMEALHDLVKEGKVRYIGASTMNAWQFQRAQSVAEANGWTKYISMQNQISLLYREEEREMLPLCEGLGVDCLAWSPLARGRLTRDWGIETKRSENDHYGQAYEKLMGKVGGGVLMEQDRKIVEEVGKIAEERGISRAQVGLAWVHAKPSVCTPIAGVGKEIHLTDAVASVDVELSEEEIQRLEANYIPHPYVNVNTILADNYKMTLK